MNRVTSLLQHHYVRYISYIHMKVAFRFFVAPVLVSFVVFGIRLLLLPVLGSEYPYTLITLGVLFVSITCGVRGGILTLLISVVLADSFLVFGRLPTFQELITHVPTVVVFLQLGLMSIIVGAMERALRYSKIETEMARLSESRFRNLADSAPVLIWTAGVDKKPTFFNKGWIDLTGRKMNQLIGNRWRRIIHPDDLHKRITTYNEAFTKQKSFRVEYRVRRYDGAFRWILDSGMPLFTENGKFSGFIGSGIDITKRKENEINLAEYVALVRSSDDAIYTKSLRGILTSWNKGAERTYGYSEKEIVGKSVSILFPKDKKKTLRTIMNSIKQGKAIEQFETQRVRKDKVTIDVSITLSPLIDEEGKIMGASTIARDITERKMLERRKDEFISMASHELKTPLTSMRAFTELMFRYIKNRDFEKVQTATTRIYSQIEKLTELTEELLDVSRMETGKLTLKKEKVNICEVVLQAIEDIRPTTDHEIEFTYQKKRISVEIDKFQVSQVLTNLLSNAIKYSPDGKKVKVHVKTTTKAVIISVRDFGIGIPKADQTKIFNRFYRVNTDRSGKMSGLGLGLYISSEIIKRHSGTMSVDSKEKKGSTFVFTLPINKRS